VTGTGIAVAAFFHWPTGNHGSTNWSRQWPWTALSPKPQG